MSLIRTTSCKSSASVILLITFSLGGIQCDFEGEEIYNEILNNVNPVIPPSLNTTIGIGLDLSSIINIDTASKTVTFCATLNLNWEDPVLSWNQKRFPEIHFVEIPSSRIWTPNIVLYNSVDDQEFRNRREGNVRIYSTGQVLWNITSIFKSSCLIDAKFYPFDQQTCILKFTATNEDIIVKLEEGTNSTRLDNFYPSVEWFLIEVPASENVHATWEGAGEVATTYVTFNLTVQRKTVWTIQVFPLLLIGFLTILPCLMGRSFGKISFQLVCLAGLRVIAMDTSKILPPTPFVLPEIYKFILFLTILNITHLTLNCLINYIKEEHFDRIIKMVPKEMISRICKVLCMDETVDAKTGDRNGEVEHSELQMEKAPMDNKIVEIIYRILSIFILLGVLNATLGFLFNPPVHTEGLRI